LFRFSTHFDDFVDYSDLSQIMINSKVSLAPSTAASTATTDEEQYMKDHQLLWTCIDHYKVRLFLSLLMTLS
jgi:hypothetical protein